MLPEKWRSTDGRRGIGWEIHVGDYGWRLIVGSLGRKGWGMGMRMFDRHEEDGEETEGNAGSEEDDRGQLTLELHLL